MAGELPTNLRPDVKAEAIRILTLVQEAGWSVEPISWEPVWDRSGERRIGFTARLEGRRIVYSTCPESLLPVRLASLLNLK
jgi:hypothetical protein